MSAPVDENVPSTAPEHCPGTNSEMAGKADACAGCPNQNVCASLPKGPDPDVAVLTERMSSVKNVILVLSGKGGVGKSTVSTQLAWTFASHGLQTGLLDIDICGPSVPRMVGAEGQSVHHSASGIEPIFVDDNLCVMSVGFFLTDVKDAVIWRGPKKNGMIKNFLKDVNWGDLDVLVIDSPPGTSDEHISVTQYLRNANVHGAVIVTTPQDVALIDVRKEVNFCRKVSIPILGVVENMSLFTCPHCHETSAVFPRKVTNGKRGIHRLCEDFNLRVLGEIPLDTSVLEACEKGESCAVACADAPATAVLADIARQLEQSMRDRGTLPS